MNFLTVLFLITQIISCEVSSQVEKKQPEKLSKSEIQERLDKTLRYEPGNLVLVDVNIISMIEDGISPNRDLYIRNGTIEKIVVHSSKNNYDGYKVIDGGHKYVIPGLSDMHVHMIAGPNLKKDLFLYLANGITTIRSMWGSEGQLTLRKSINEGEVLSPKLFVASPGFDGSRGYWPGSVVTSSPSQVRDKVKELKEKGYDFLKVYSGIPHDHYDALIDQARKESINPVGHVPNAVSIKEAISSKLYSIEHLWGYATWLNPISDEGWSELDNLALDVAENEVWNCPTLSVTNRSKNKIGDYQNSNFFEYISPELQSFMKSPPTQPVATAQQVEIIHSQQKTFLNILNKNNTGIISGTDVGLRYVFPGFTLLEELQYYKDAGMDNFEILATSTKNAGDFLKERKIGRIASGNYADLVLLKEDPLKDIANLKKIDGVIRNGTWFGNDTIEEILSLIKQSYENH